MNDDFIHRALPEVPHEFAQSLYSKISTVTPMASQRGIYPLLGSVRWSRVGIIILGVFLLIAWSQLRFWIRYVPIGDLWLVEFAKTTEDSQAAIPFVPTPLPTLDWTRTLAPDELFFYLYFPSWIPEGFRAIAPCPGTTCYDQTIAQWSNDLGQRIRLFIEAKAGGMHPYAPSGMWKEVDFNGQPGVLIYGRLALMKPGEKTRKWDETLGLQLYRLIGKYVYVLETFGPYVSEEDLIRMAQSMEELPPPWLTVTP